MPAANNGNFTVSFWFKSYTTADNGTLFGYMLSATANANRDALSTVDTFGPNQINVFLPDEGHPAFGMVMPLTAWLHFHCMASAALPPVPGVADASRARSSNCCEAASELTMGLEGYGDFQ